MTDITPNHPAVEAAARSAYERAWCGENEPWSEVDDLERDEWRADEAHSLTAALPHLTAEDLPTRLVRDIQVRTIRATARAVAYEEDGTPWDHDWDRATVAAWLDGLADNIEGDDTA